MRFPPGRLVSPLAVLFAPAFAAGPALTLREAVELALQQNPDVALARLEERKAEREIEIARSPFVPTLAVGSGLAWSSGFPMSIEGATPSVFQARAIADLYNRPQSYRVAAAREIRRGVVFDLQAKQEQVALRTAELYLEAERAARLLEAARRQVESLAKVAEIVEWRVKEGHELAIEARRAALELAKARHRVVVLDNARRNAEEALRVTLGLEPGQALRLAGEERPPWPLPATAEAAMEQALAHSHELRALEARLLAKGLEARAERAARLPRLELVAQYGLLARFNNYEEFFRKFERHNGQLGVSFQLPLFVGHVVEARAGKVEAEAAQLRIELRRLREQIGSEARRLHQAAREAEAAAEVARLELELARERVSIVLARMDEGRAGLRQLEEARFEENEKWIAFYDARYRLEAARLAVLARTGNLLAALR
ncbi:MAG: TolC family protein [Bryobacterales bacterium]|nr:TolC family protein [Bryobacteraceae bacterium]MDW8129285.1 TolC family protein [Bryobacterales bacterium]